MHWVCTKSTGAKWQNGTPCLRGVGQIFRALEVTLHGSSCDCNRHLADKKPSAQDPAGPVVRAPRQNQGAHPFEIPALTGLTAASSFLPLLPTLGRALAGLVAHLQASHAWDQCPN